MLYSVPEIVMNITWHGLSCFEITVKSAFGEVTIVADPYQNTTGLRFPRTLEAQIVFSSMEIDEANGMDSVAGKPYCLNIPGEFEVKDVFLFGISVPLTNERVKHRQAHRIYRIEVEDMRLAHLGQLNRTLTDEELESLGNIDILLVPVGGDRVLTPKGAVEVIAQIEPRVVIPMTFQLPNLKESLEPVEAFLKESGVASRETFNKLKIQRKELPEEEMKIVILSR